MVWIRATLVGVVGAAALACGGVGSSASDYAVKYAEHRTGQAPEAPPCEALGVGSPAVIGTWTYEFLTPEIVKPEHRRPWISSSEGRMMEGAGLTAIAFPYRLRNDSPVKDEPYIFIELRLPNGEQAQCGPENGEMYRESRDQQPRGVRNSWLTAPGEYNERVLVCPGGPEVYEGAVMYVYEIEVRRDVFDRRSDVTVDHAVVDLGTPVEGDPVNKDHDKEPPPAPVRGGPKRKK